MAPAAGGRRQFEPWIYCRGLVAQPPTRLDEQTFHVEYCQAPPDCRLIGLPGARPLSSLHASPAWLAQSPPCLCTRGQALSSRPPLGWSSPSGWLVTRGPERDTDRQRGVWQRPVDHIPSLPAEPEWSCSSWSSGMSSNRRAWLAGEITVVPQGAVLRSRTDPDCAGARSRRCPSRQ